VITRSAFFLFALAVSHASSRPAETSISGNWQLIPENSRFGSYTPVSCKLLQIQVMGERAVISFDERLRNGKSQKGTMILPTDGTIMSFTTAQPLSPGDDWEATLRSASAAWRGDNLVVEENDERRIDRSRSTSLYLRGGQLIARTESHSIIGDRSALLLFERTRKASC
jgi:hypothetical protein